jgi:hypothetical protein
MLGVLPHRVLPHSILLAFFQFYIENDLRKNKLYWPSLPIFLGISTKFEALALNLG